MVFKRITGLIINKYLDDLNGSCDSNICRGTQENISLSSLEDSFALRVRIKLQCYGLIKPGFISVVYYEYSCYWKRSGINDFIWFNITKINNDIKAISFVIYVDITVNINHQGEIDH